MKYDSGEVEMKTEINSDTEKDRIVKTQVIYLGLATFFIITAVSLISSNKPEFVQFKFTDGTSIAARIKLWGKQLPLPRAAGLTTNKKGRFFTRRGGQALR